MGTRVIAILAGVVVAGCSPHAESFVCSGNPSSSCGPGGTCEANGFCSFQDVSCPSGRRYGDLGGGGQCVGSQPMPDAGPDAPPDARVCFGTAPFTFCFTTPPAGAIDVSMPTTFDTVNGTVMGTQLNCATPRSGDPNNSYCVLAANTITITQPLRATGTKPLVLLAVDSISVPMSIDVGSHRNPVPPVDSIGAGANPATSCGNGTPPTFAMSTGGGGAGGSSMGIGGGGGNGAGVNGGGGGVHAGAPGFSNVIRGGCPGQDGAGGNKGARGQGGGAVFLIAGNSITVGGMINAGGEGGAPGTDNSSGGGGGGAGGLIGFDAMTVTVTGTLIANGGAGGEGSGNSTPGLPGADADSTNAAKGGGDASNGGDGGDGSAGAANGPGMNGKDGTGGGGGGGGAGLIKGPPPSLGTKLSPAATP